MRRITMLALCLATSCSSSSPVERTTTLPEQVAPSAVRSEEPDTEPDGVARSADPESTAEVTHLAGDGYLCVGDRCPAVPPPCPVGHVLSVMGEGGCWGDCVPFGECGCRTDADCRTILGGTCGPSGRCGVDCDVSHVSAPVAAPSCRDGQVPSVVHGAWGPCVPALTCA